MQQLSEKLELCSQCASIYAYVVLFT